MKKKFSDNLEKFLIMNMTYIIVVYMSFMMIVPYLGIWVYYLLMLISVRRIIVNINLLSYYWDYPEDCPGVEWCEKLTMRLFANGKIRKN